MGSSGRWCWQELATRWRVTDMDDIGSLVFCTCAALLAAITLALCAGRKKRCEDFRLPLDAILQTPELEVRTTGQRTIVVSPVEIMTISGQLSEGTLFVKTVEYSGEGSGWFWDKFLELLSASKGAYEAVVIWEGGDSIDRLIVDDGKVAVTRIEL